MAIKNRSIQQVLLSVFIIVSILNAIHIDSAQAATIQSSQAAVNSQVSCIRPESYEVRRLCVNLEEKILAVTVRIELHTWATFSGYQKAITTKSHATILGGKYLVTHNHYMYSLTEQVVAFGEVQGYTGISLRTASGKLLLENAPLNSFSIVYADAETLILAFVDDAGRGLFAAANLPSAKFASMDSLSLKAGVELAQIDWNGETAHVDWVIVDNVSLTDDVPQFQVNNFPKKGCSGGGVFWNGIHIGNNWAKNIEKDPATDEITRRYSIIALNSDFIASFSE